MVERHRSWAKLRRRNLRICGRGAPEKRGEARKKIPEDMVMGNGMVFDVPSDLNGVEVMREIGIGDLQVIRQRHNAVRYSEDGVRAATMHH